MRIATEDLWDPDPRVNELINKKINDIRVASEYLQVIHLLSSHEVKEQSVRITCALAEVAKTQAEIERIKRLAQEGEKLNG